MAEEKLKILYLMKLLQEETDPAHPLNARQLCEGMMSRFGLSYERKTIYKDMERLKSYGVKIGQKKGAMKRMEDRPYGKKIIPFLAYAVFAIFLCMIMPVSAKAADKGTIRALLISGKSEAPDVDSWGNTDAAVEDMQDMLFMNKLPDYASVNISKLKIVRYRGDYDNHGMTKENFIRDIKQAFVGSLDKDLNFYYFTGHGNQYGIGPRRGDLSLTYPELLTELTRYRGTFVLFLETCGVGKFWDSYAALSPEDKERFLVFTADEYFDEEEENWSGTVGTLFAQTIMQGCDYTNSYLPADKNKNGFITATELGEYVQNKVHVYRFIQTAQYTESDRILFQFDSVTSITGEGISDDDYTLEMYVGDSTELTAKTEPTKSKHLYLWTTSDMNDVALVYPDGKKATVVANEVGESWVSACIIDENGNEGYESTIFVKVEDPVPVYQDISKAANGKAGIRITWPISKNADGYRIYRKTEGGKYELLAIADGNWTTGYTDKTAKNGKLYTYTVRGYIITNNGKTFLSNYNRNGISIYRLTRPSLKKCASDNPGEISLTWNKNGSATGFQAAFSLNQNFSGSEYVRTNTNSMTQTNLKYGRKYYVRIRSYRRYGGKNYYSAWSDTKAVTVKKQTIVLDRTAVTLLVGESVKLNADAAGSSAGDIRWKSSNTGIATVSNGRVTARKKGRATITASIGKASAKCSVTVVDYFELYREFLEKPRVTISDDGNTFSVVIKSFLLLDIDGNRIPELCVNVMPSTGGGGVQCYIYTIRNGKLQYVGDYSQKGTSKLYYIAKYKALRSYWWTNGIGGTGDRLEIMKNYRLKPFKYFYESQESRTSTNRIYQYGTSSDNYRNVSQAYFQRMYETYVTGIKEYSFKDNTVAIRDSVFR